MRISTARLFCILRFVRAMSPELLLQFLQRKVQPLAVSQRSESSLRGIKRPGLSAWRSVSQTRWLMLLLAFTVTNLNAQVIISEFMASNSSTLRDEDGDSSDWIEVFNTSSSTANLSAWAL